MMGLTSLLEGKFNSIISKSHMDMGRANLFQMDIPTAGITGCMQTIAHSVKVS